MALYSIDVVIRESIIIYYGTLFIGVFESEIKFKEYLQLESTPTPGDIRLYTKYYIIKIINNTLDYGLVNDIELYVKQVQNKSVLFIEICNFISSILRKPLELSMFKNFKINIYDKPFSIESGQRHIYEISLIEIKDTFTDGTYTDGGLTGIEIHGPNGYHEIFYDESINNPDFNTVIQNCLPYVDKNCYLQFTQNVNDEQLGFNGDSSLIKITNGLQEAIQFEF